MINAIYPCLWFNGRVQEAAEFYTSIFPNSRILSANPVVVNLDLNGRKVMLLNGGPQFPQSENISLVVECETQEEIDYYWNHFTTKGQESQCGWCKDEFGVSWQIIPAILGELMSDPSRAPRVSEAFLKMKKFDIQALINA